MFVAGEPYTLVCWHWLRYIRRYDEPLPWLWRRRLVYYHCSRFINGYVGIEDAATTLIIGLDTQMFTRPANIRLNVGGEVGGYHCHYA